jgi:hypothetical protein
MVFHDFLSAYAGLKACLCALGSPPPNHTRTPAAGPISVRFGRFGSDLRQSINILSWLYLCMTLREKAVARLCRPPWSPRSASEHQLWVGTLRASARASAQHGTCTIPARFNKHHGAQQHRIRQISQPAAASTSELHSERTERAVHQIQGLGDCGRYGPLLQEPLSHVSPRVKTSKSYDFSALPPYPRS